MSDPQLPPPVPQAPYPPFGQSSAPSGGQHALPPQGFPQPPQGQPPVYSPPAGAYAAGPTGYHGVGGPYTPPTPVSPKASSAIGVWALILALIALIVPSVVGGVAGFEMGMRLGAIDPEFIETSPVDDLAMLAPSACRCCGQRSPSGSAPCWASGRSCRASSRSPADVGAGRASAP
ncbi:hypothetical protein [Microbacterium sp. NIBRBAC000506063]|uniref:hypothetical protein n=1 Tax=Microbacterium sp. NIBRBAC000506063 TaxID=2734618 RepID=UPI001BB4A013|nr:hypothetical protein [Microbacterium sp. NIBRBAC000506063]QTV79902.1 hypothetical protein KAE78_01470 [Microbacterium sp. NIBRBAC000506063]